MNEVPRHRRPRSLARAWLPWLLIAAAAVAFAWDRILQTEPSPSESAAYNPASDAPKAWSLSEAVLPSVTARVPAVTPTPTPVTIRTMGSGTFTSADGRSPAVGGGQQVAYRVEVEDSLPISANAFAAEVDKTLGDERGWTTRGYVLHRTPDAQLRVVLASPATTDRLCRPLQTRGKVSCRNGNDVVINARRWVNGAKSYSDDLVRYRQYVVNHEVGHSFGLGHRSCPKPGAKAPVMLQQTLGLQGCEANPWP